MSKYQGMVFEGRWKVIKITNELFILENIYNHEIMELKPSVFRNVIIGKTTISNIRCTRAYCKTQEMGMPKIIKRQKYMLKKRKLEKNEN